MADDTSSRRGRSTLRNASAAGDLSPLNVALSVIFCLGLLFTLLIFHFAGPPTQVSALLLLFYKVAWSSTWIALGLLALRQVWSFQPWWVRILPTLCIAVALLELVGGFISIGIAPSLTDTFARLYYPAGELALALLLLSLLVGLLARVRRGQRDLRASR